ncbi:TetR/AcrR family transcriptional regulator (plasmid) [Streptomyces sp. NBC_00190]|uniref:ScbR family autoregulator-binding transcription factor n=1 Tax=unclassified Streptomyces TaxID=2593676 RepID=UPI002E2A3D11|nr:ScbR family autoregulator-binding transcription factor [Streptomyces sp. NBC_00190]WSZ45757.1 TetR/AcrR family transcriptional regulator [Streptomyces sp. NBC_00868]
MHEPKQERAARTREQILRAAATLIEEYGYRGTSMRALAQQAGVTLGAVYFHFPNKEELARAVINAQPDTIVPYLGSAGLQRLVDITLVWSWRLRTDLLLRAGVQLAVEQRALGVQDDTSFRDWEEIMEACLKDAQAGGELLDGIDPAEVAQFIVGTCTGTQLHSQLMCGRADLTDRVVRMWRFLLPGLAPAAVAASIDLDPNRGKGESIAC